MRRVYLDQNMWINLAKLLAGRTDGQRYADAYDLAQEGVRRGLVSFPLSTIHYQETHKTRSARQRQQVGEAMLSLARRPGQIGPDTMAGQPTIVPGEIDRALKARFGRPKYPRPLAVFGEGIGHAFGRPGHLRYHLPDDLPVTPATRQLERLAAMAMEQGLLTGVYAGTEAHQMDPTISAQLYQGIPNDYVLRQQRIAEGLKRLNIKKGARRQELTAVAILDIREPLAEAMHQAGIAANEFESLSAEELTAFLEDVPTRYVETELSIILHGEEGYRPAPNDLNDVLALCAAIVYCDVVVTERKWVHLLRRASVDKRFNTVIFHDLTELAPELVKA